MDTKLSMAWRLPSSSTLAEFNPNGSSTASVVFHGDNPWWTHLIYKNITSNTTKKRGHTISIDNIVKAKKKSSTGSAKPNANECLVVLHPLLCLPSLGLYVMIDPGHFSNQCSNLISAWVVSKNEPVHTT